jgi:hypothetical protein
MTYRSLRKAERATRLDRDTWAGTSLLILTYDTIGAGTFETDLLDFGLVFEEAPFFAYGAELQPGETLIAGDYPIVNCGVTRWETNEDPETRVGNVFYLGAYVWINVSSNSTYRMRFRLSFEGTAMRNVEYFRG